MHTSYLIKYLHTFIAVYINRDSTRCVVSKEGGSQMYAFGIGI